tara:strand:- start:259 stop:534 length:276 start_codon:yes stop_codon:yes gene_type:complete
MISECFWYLFSVNKKGSKHMTKLITIKQSTFDKAINALNKEKKELRDLLELSRNRSNELYDLLQTMRGKLAQSEKEKERLQTLITQSIKCL